MGLPHLMHVMSRSPCAVRRFAPFAPGVASVGSLSAVSGSGLRRSGRGRGLIGGGLRDLLRGDGDGRERDKSAEAHGEIFVDHCEFLLKRVFRPFFSNIFNLRSPC